MNIKYSIILGLFIFISVTTLTSCGGGAMRAEAALKNFSKQIEQGNLDNLRLRIYYLSPNILTPFPVSVESLINSEESDQVQKFVIDGNSLEEHIGLLKQVGNITLIPVKDKSYIDARIYYVFETNKGKKIFDVAMWGYLEGMGEGDDELSIYYDELCIHINGVAFKENDIFYDLIIPFLPEDEAYIVEGFKQENQE